MLIICMLEFYILGYLGPIVLFFVIVYLLWDQSVLYVYVIGFLLNSIINLLLKVTLKQSRPSNGKSILHESYEGIEKYGMPSGHAQSVFFSFSFLYFYGYDSLWASSIVVLTIYQRWIYRQHSIDQLLVGSLIGIGVAYAMRCIHH